MQQTNSFALENLYPSFLEVSERIPVKVVWPVGFGWLAGVAFFCPRTALSSLQALPHPADCEDPIQEH